jgi:hypothetical protein
VATKIEFAMEVLGVVELLVLELLAWEIFHLHLQHREQMVLLVLEVLSLVDRAQTAGAVEGQMVLAHQTLQGVQEEHFL